jgi:hypothetical protein
MPGTGPSRDRNARDRHGSLAGNPRSTRSLGAKYRTGVYLRTGADQAQLLNMIRTQPQRRGLPITSGWRMVGRLSTRGRRSSISVRIGLMYRAAAGTGLRRRAGIRWRRALRGRSSGRWSVRCAR